MEWGALKLGYRISYIDLNDESIKGKKEGRPSDAQPELVSQSQYPLMFNHFRTNIGDRVSPPLKKGRSNIFQARFQIA